MLDSHALLSGLKKALIKSRKYFLDISLTFSIAAKFARVIEVGVTATRGGVAHEVGGMPGTKRGIVVRQVVVWVVGGVRAPIRCPEEFAVALGGIVASNQVWVGQSDPELFI